MLTPQYLHFLTQACRQIDGDGYWSARDLFLQSLTRVPLKLWNIIADHADTPQLDHDQLTAIGRALVVAIAEDA